MRRLTNELKLFGKTLLSVWRYDHCRQQLIVLLNSAVSVFLHTTLITSNGRGAE